jgi:hypothetical protein
MSETMWLEHKGLQTRQRLRELNILFFLRSGSGSVNVTTHLHGTHWVDLASNTYCEALKVLARARFSHAEMKHAEGSSVSPVNFATQYAFIPRLSLNLG